MMKNQSEDPFHMRPLWDALLEVYEEFANVCNRNGLRFFLCEGSAIGALRNRGFIPWDDDLDVIMPRPDYERFRQICGRELPPHLRFVNYENAPEFQYTFGKIQDVREEHIYEVERRYGEMLPGGIYVDILVVDGAPDGFWASKLHKLRRLCFLCQQRFRTFRFSEMKKSGKILWVCGAVLSVSHPLEKWRMLARRYENFMKSVPFESAKATWRDSATWKAVRLTYPRCVWDKSIDMKFDEIVAPLPIGYDTYLRAQYGDYMTPPPREMQRTTHHYEGRSPWWLGPTLIPVEEEECR